MTSTIAIRIAHADEAADVRRLAALDSAARLRGDVLLARVDGRAVAALSLVDGRAVADPFVPTTDLVKLLRVRAAALRDRSQASPATRLWRRRATLAA